MIWSRHRLDWAAGIKRDAGTDGMQVQVQSVNNRRHHVRVCLCFVSSCLVSSSEAAATSQKLTWRSGVEDPSINRLQSQLLIQKNNLTNSELVSV